MYLKTLKVSKHLHPVVCTYLVLSTLIGSGRPAGIPLLSISIEFGQYTCIRFPIAILAGPSISEVAPESLVGPENTMIHITSQALPKARGGG